MASEQRMVSVALRHISGIQKGIQSAHAIVDYATKYRDTAEYKRWSKRDKTLYVLEAHTDGQLQEAYDKLKALKVPVMLFREPDMGNIITAITFLIDSTVWDTKKYGNIQDSKVLEIRKIKNQFNLGTN